MQQRGTMPSWDQKKKEKGLDVSSSSHINDVFNSVPGEETNVCPNFQYFKEFVFWSLFRIKAFVPLSCALGRFGWVRLLFPPVEWWLLPRVVLEALHVTHVRDGIRRF